MSMSDKNIGCEIQISPTIKRDKDISSSAGSLEPSNQHDPKISQLGTSFFDKASDYLVSELTSTKEEYRLLEKMNKLTTEKYEDMQQITKNVSTHMKALNERYTEIQPLLSNIMELKEKVVTLEDCVYRLDAYAKRLEQKYKGLNKKYVPTTRES